MIIYSVTIKVNKDTEAEWLKWMRRIHIPDVMKTGYFIKWKMQELFETEDNKCESTFRIEYSAQSINKYNMYLEKEAERLQNEHKKKFNGKYTATRAVYLIIPK